jgi:hypothetical protein
LSEMNTQNNEPTESSNKFPFISFITAVIILIVCVIWYFKEFSFDSLIGIIGSLSALIIAVFVKLDRKIHRKADVLGAITLGILSLILIIPKFTSPATDVIEQNTPTPTISPTPTNDNPAPTPTLTPIPIGPELLRLDFIRASDGNCDTHDSNILGYESGQYYIQSPASNGYIAQCASGDWGPRVSIEVEAYPRGDLAFWGYGLIIGWHGSDGRTTDGCFLSVRRTSGIEPVSEVIAIQRIDRVQETIYRENLPVPLETRPQKLRLVMVTDSLGIGYLDDQFIGQFEFNGCTKGRIGMVAYGTGDTRVYFTNLKLNSLP